MSQALPSQDLLSELLSPEELNRAQELIQAGRFAQEALEDFLAQKKRQQEAGLKAISGQICYVDPPTQTLYIEDYQTGKINQAYALRPEPKSSVKPPERWGNTSVLTSYQDGKQIQQLNLPLAKQGLLVTAGPTYLYPFNASHSHLGISPQYYCPYQPSPEQEAHDLVVSPGQDLLFVIHRWEGKLSLFSLPRGHFLGSFSIRGQGSKRSLNIAVDASEQRAYISDNETDQLHILDLNQRELSSASLFLGKLGNLALDRNPGFLYLEVLEPTLSLAYLDLEHLNIITLLDIKGGSLCVDAGRPVDLMQFTPEKELLLFMTYLDSPQPLTPVVQVIETARTRTIRRYAIKEGGPPQHLAVAHPNLNHLKKGTLLERFLADLPAVEEAPPKALPKAPLEHQLENPVPPITLPEQAEDAIVTLCQQEVEARYHIQLRLHPLEKRKIREQAADLRKALETVLATEAELQIMHRFSFKLPLNRQRVLQEMARNPKHSGPLYLPESACPICGAAIHKLPCTHCGFSLELGPTSSTAKTKPARPKAPPLSQDRQAYIELLQRVSFLKEANPTLLQALARCLQSEHLPAGEVLIHEGQVGSCLYFVTEGQLNVFKAEDPKQSIATLVEGDVVGEMSVVTSEARSASVAAREDCSLLRLDRSAFLNVIVQHPDFSRQLKALAYTRQSMTRKFKNNLQRNTMDRVRARMAIAKLQELKIFQGAPQEVFEALASKVRPVAFMPKQEVCIQGEDADRLYFIVRGNVDVLVDQHKVTSLSEGDLFGEMAWLLQKPRSATVLTTSYCRFMELDFADFAAVIAHYPRLQQALEEMANTRQAELEQLHTQAEAAGPELPLPGLQIEVRRHVPVHTLYYLSPLEEEVFRLEHNQVQWRFGQEGEVHLFQPYRAQYTETYEPCLLIADSGNDRILEVQLESGQVSRTWGDHRLPLIQPRSACFTPQGWLLVADEGQQRLLMINLQGEIAWEYERHVISPYHVSQTPEGHVLYADAAMHQVVEISLEGDVLWSYGTPFIAGDQAGELKSPSFVQRCDNGLTLIADTGNQRLVWVNPAQEVEAIWTGTADHPLIDPMHCEWDEDGFLYVHSGTAENVLCFSSAGDVVWQGTLLPL